MTNYLLRNCDVIKDIKVNPDTIRRDFGTVSAINGDEMVIILAQKLQNEYDLDFTSALKYSEFA